MTTPQPQGQNPFNQAPQGDPQQPQFNQGAPVPPPAAPSRGINKKLLRVGAVILVAILIGVGKWYFNQTDAETAAVGDCMQNEGTNFKPDMKQVDCSSGDAEFKIVEKFDNTSDGKKCEAVTESEVAYYQSGDGHNVVLCMKSV